MSMYKAWFQAEKSCGKQITGTRSAVECDASGLITADVTIFLHGDSVIGEYDAVSGKLTIK